MTLSQIIWQSPVAAASTVNVVGTFAALSAGNVATTSTLTQPTGGTLQTGTFSNVPLTGGTGSGALATVSVVSGDLLTVNTIVQPTGGTNKFVAGAVTFLSIAGTNGATGTFTAGDVITQATSGATAHVAVTNTGTTPLLVTTIAGTPDATHGWTDTTTPGATFTPTSVPSSFTAGETVTQATSGATAHVVGTTTTNATSFTILTSSITGTPDGTHVWTGGTSHSTFTPTAVPSFALNGGPYTGIALTGGTGSGAVASITVAGGSVTTVTVTSPGVGYVVGDVLSFTGANLGTGGTVKAATVTDAVTSVVVTNSGSGYVVGDVLTYTSAQVGTGGTITVATISASGPGDTLTAASNAVLVVDTYTPVVNDRLLLKNQATGLQNGIYNVAQVNASGIISGTTGPIASVGNITQPTGGTITPGTYPTISLTGGSGSGAVGTVQVMSSQVTSVVVTTPGTGYKVNDTLGFTASGIGTGGTVKVLSTGATVQPTGGTIKNGAYLGVPLSAGTGTGARATVVVAGNVVTEVNITNPGINYAINDVLHYDANGQGFGNGGTVTVATVTIPFSGSGAQGGLILTTSGFTQPTGNFVTNGSYGNFPLTGGSGTGATANITITNGVVNSVVIVNPGTGYTATNVLGFTGTINTPTQGLGSGGTITVPTVTFNPWILTRAPDANLSIQLPGLAVFVAGGSQVSTAWVQNAFPVTIDTTPLTFVAFNAL